MILLTAGLRSRGYETELLVGNETEREGNMLDLAAAKGVECHRLPGLQREIAPVDDFRAFLGIARTIRRGRPQVVHSHTAKAGVLARAAARMMDVPLVVHTFHGHVLKGYFGPRKTAFFRWLETTLGRSSDALLAVSPSVAADLSGLGVAPADRIQVLPLGLELARLAETLPKGHLRSEARFPAEARIVGLVGRLVPIKSAPTFLEAARIAAQSDPRLHFSIVGDGEERARLEMLTGSLGLDGKLHFHGWHRDMTRVYGDLDLVVNCSLNEGTPVALIEAMAAGKPVIATDVGGNRDLLGDGVRGRLIRPQDPQALARAMLEVLKDDRADDSARLAAARDHVLSAHAIERLLDDMDSLYRRLLAPKGVLVERS